LNLTKSSLTANALLETANREMTMQIVKQSVLVLAALLAVSTTAHAASCGNSAKGFPGFIKEFRKEAAAAGVSERGLSLLDGVEYQPAIIKKDRSQSVFPLASSNFRSEWYLITVSRKAGRSSSATRNSLMP
jgi:membrane-bound lytic murein transglycosylase B